jgi:hypothetical protein
MPLKLAVPLEEEFKLVQTDLDYGKKGDEPTTVMIRQARQGEHERRASLFAQIVREQAINAPDDIVRFIQRFSFEELKRLEVFLTIKACNITKPDGKPLWDFNEDGKIREGAFNEGWAMLPVPVAQEIHDCVLTLNIDWQPVVGEDF